MNQTLQQNTYANFERLRAKLRCILFESGVCVRECMYAYMYSKSYNNRSKYLSNDMYFKSETLLRLYNKRTDAIQLMPNGDPIYPSSTSDLAKASLTLLSSLASWLTSNRFPARLQRNIFYHLQSAFSHATSIGAEISHSSHTKFSLLGC